MPVTPPTLLNDPYEHAKALLTIAANQIEDPTQRVWAAEMARHAVTELLNETIEAARAQGVPWEALDEIRGYHPTPEVSRWRENSTLLTAVRRLKRKSG